MHVHAVSRSYLTPLYTPTVSVSSRRRDLRGALSVYILCIEGGVTTHACNVLVGGSGLTRVKGIAMLGLRSVPQEEC